MSSTFTNLHELIKHESKEFPSSLIMEIFIALLVHLRVKSSLHLKEYKLKAISTMHASTDIKGNEEHTQPPLTALSYDP